MIETNSSPTNPTTPKNAALAVSGSTGSDKALPLTETDSAASFLFGSFSFAEKEKEQPLTLHTVLQLLTRH